MTSEGIERRYPGLVEALARHPGIGAVIGRSAEGHTLLLGADGQHDLDATPPDGRDLLAEYGPTPSRRCVASRASQLPAT
jgi:predicted ABC-class ATPase